MSFSKFLTRCAIIIFNMSQGCSWSERAEYLSECLRRELEDSGVGFLVNKGQISVSINSSHLEMTGLSPRQVVPLSGRREFDPIGQGLFTLDRVIFDLVDVCGTRAADSMVEDFSVAIQSGQSEKAVRFEISDDIPRALVPQELTGTTMDDARLTIGQLGGRILTDEVRSAEGQIVGGRFTIELPIPKTVK